MINKQNSKSDTKGFLTFDEALKKIEEEIKTALSSPPPLISRFTEYLSRSTGKNLRARALITCAMNDEEMIHPNAVKFAAAIEILHLATLVHDDVIDNSDERRGMPTLQKVFGKKTAVICGDYLLCVALTTAASADNIREYADIKLPIYVKRICTGELRQHLHNNNLNLSIREYLKIISGKTATLFQASFNAGIVLCEKDQNKVSQYLKLGRYIGMIFQLMDDCADFEGSRDEEKKPVKSDFEQGVITLPLVIALRNPTFKNKVRKHDVTNKDIQRMVEQSGGISFSKLLAKRYYDKAWRIIEDIDPAGIKKRKLLGILNKAGRYD